MKATKQTNKKKKEDQDTRVVSDQKKSLPWQRNRGKNRMGKTRDHFKKIRDTKKILHTKRSTIKNRSGLDLTEAEDTEKKWQEYTEELYKNRSS